MQIICFVTLIILGVSTYIYIYIYYTHVKDVNKIFQKTIWTNSSIWTFTRTIFWLLAKENVEFYTLHVHLFSGYTDLKPFNAICMSKKLIMTLTRMDNILYLYHIITCIICQKLLDTIFFTQMSFYFFQFIRQYFKITYLVCSCMIFRYLWH